jgi:hypothetical protein
MARMRYLIGTAADGTKYNFVEERRGNPAVCSYRMSSLAGRYLTKVSDTEFTIVGSGIHVYI